jgi:hypothetical protein
LASLRHRIRIDGDAKEVAEMLAVLVGGDKEENAMKVEG